MVKTSLLFLDPSKYIPTLAKLLKKDAKKKVIYFTAGQTHNHLSELLRKKGVNPERILFIDCISKTASSKTAGSDNCILIDSPQSLTEISIAISESVKNMKGDKVLILDSLSMMLMYNEANTIGKFSSFIVHKMQAQDVDIVLLALQSDNDKQVVRQIEMLADEVTRI